jgi:hypothetical protein
MKPLAIASSGVGIGLHWGDGGANLTNVHCKAIGNWHNESPLYNEYMLIKMGKKDNLEPKPINKIMGRTSWCVT